jgi:hypothetical protein
MIKRIYEKIGRMIFWGWNLRDSHDWDYFYIFHILELKLERIYDTISEGPVDWDYDEEHRNAIQSLEKCVGLLKCLNHEEDFHGLFDTYEQEWRDELFDLMKEYGIYWWD